MIKKVSIIATVYNEEYYISEMVKSLVCQDYPNIEIIVVDDGSTDATPDVLAELAACYCNVVPVYLPKNVGKAAAQNAGFKVAMGEYIGIIGGDDFALYNRVSSQVEILERGPFQCVFTNLILVNESGELSGSSPLFYTAPPVLKSDPKSLLRGCSVPGGTLLFTRALAHKIYPIPEDLPYEDRWFSFVALQNGGMEYIHRPLNYYRRHAGNTWGVSRSVDLATYVRKSIYYIHREYEYVGAIASVLRATEQWTPSLECYLAFLMIYHSQKLTATIAEKIKLVYGVYRCISIREALHFVFPRVIIAIRFAKHVIFGRSS